MATGEWISDPEDTQAHYVDVAKKLEDLASDPGVNHGLADRLKAFAEEIRSDIKLRRSKAPTVRSAWPQPL